MTTTSHTEQLKAWALDRAIETLKIGGNPITGADVMATAESFCEWVYSPETDLEEAAE